jgi:hypothetical protein
MSRLNTLRRTSLLLVTAAVAGLASSVVKAEGLSINLCVDGTYETTRNGDQTVFIDPGVLPSGNLMIDVYATVTGTQANGTTALNGLQYAYFGVQANSIGSENLLGETAVTSAPTLAAAFAGLGSQAGTAGTPGTPVGSSGVFVVGNATSGNYTAFGKARAVVTESGTTVNGFVNTTSNISGTAVPVPSSSTTTSFLIEQIPISIASLANQGEGITLTPVIPSGFTNSIPAALWSESSAAGAKLYTPSGQNGGGVYNAGSYTPGNTVTLETVGQAVTNGDLLPGDTDFSGTVDYTDFGTLSRFYGQTDASWQDGNFEYNPADTADTGTIGYTDFGDLSRYYGQSNTLPGAALPSNLVAAPAGVSAVPEPGMISLLVTAGFGLAMRRRRR